MTTEAPTADSPLTAEQLAAYERDGYLLVRQALDPEKVARLRPGILEAFERLRPPDEPNPGPRTAYQEAFIQVVNMGLQSEAVRALTWSPELGAIAAALMHVDGARIFIEDAMFKEPGRGHTPWHQDGSCMPMVPRHMVTAWVPLVPVHAGSGRLRFIPGSHTRGLLGPVDISEETDAMFGRMLEEEDLPIVELPDMEPGDVSFHAGTTIHSANPNTSDRMRELLAIHYFADGARLGPLDNPTRANLARHVAPELTPGDLAVAPGWPLVYSRRDG